MQEVCSSINANQLGGSIKSESALNTLQHQAMQAKLVSNCDKRIDAATYWMNAMPPNSTGSVVGGASGNNIPNVSPTESGFINSQPSMAEFMTHIDPDSPKMIGTSSYNAMQNDQCDGVPEYPWMKEKKTARKNNSQGKSVWQIQDKSTAIFLLTSSSLELMRRHRNTFLSLFSNNSENSRANSVHSASTR